MPKQKDLTSPPLISIITRTKDRPSMLQEAIASVTAQTYPNIELVVVNDGGNDVEQLLNPARLRLSGVNYVNLNENIGRAGAANAGLDNTHGEYILFLDDDDLIDPDHLSSLYNALQSNPDVALAYSGVRVGTSTTFNAPYNKEYLQAFNYIPIHAALFSRKFLQMGCRFDQSLESFEDWDFWIQLSQYSEFFHLNQLSADYRDMGDSDGGTFKTTLKVQQNRHKVLKKWLTRWSVEQLDAIFYALRDYPSEKEIKLEIEYTNLNQHMLAQNAERQRLENKNHFLQQQNQQYAAAQQRLEAHIHQLEEHRRQLEEHRRQLEEHRDQIEEHRDQLDEHRQQLEAHIHHLEDHRQQLEEQLQQLVQDNTQLSALYNETRQHLEAEIARLTTQYQELSSLWAETQHSLNDILQSSAWRMTFPLRWTLAHLYALGKQNNNPALQGNTAALNPPDDKRETHDTAASDAVISEPLSVIDIEDSQVTDTIPEASEIQAASVMQQTASDAVISEPLSEIDIADSQDADTSSEAAEVQTASEKEQTVSIYTQEQDVQETQKNISIPFNLDDIAAKPDPHHPLFRQLFDQSVGQRSNYVEHSVYPVDTAEKLKYIAFYLPQFHPIPENDEWWGKGFTEWSNVAKATPQFEGHYQPHLPGELGFYDLRLYEVLKRQVELAQHYGIHGFCFYHYWFGGKRLLERPFQHILEHPELEVNFCLCWANENWTRRWDGLEQEILIAQQHSDEDDMAFIRDIEAVLKDGRYIRINGKPLLLLYRPSLLPDAAATLQRWRQYCRDCGIGEIFLAMSQSFGDTDPRQYGFDAAVEFPPHGSIEKIREITADLNLYNHEYSGHVYSYEELVENTQPDIQVPYSLFRGIFPGWDNEARKPGKGNTFTHSSPDLYQHWLEKISHYALHAPVDQQSVVFINAWNEWGEGAHLEPDKKYGYAYLEATARTLQYFSEKNRLRIEATQKDITQQHEIAVVLHLFYPELWDEIQTYLNNISDGFDLYISIPRGIHSHYLDRILLDYPAAHLFDVENRGRDISPFLQIMNIIWPLNYSYLCKLHSKKSLYFDDGASWRSDLFTKLLGKPDEGSRHIKQILSRFTASDKAGIIGPHGYRLPLQPNIGSNEQLMRDVLRQLGWDLSLDRHFIAGSMFWCKPQALIPLSLLKLTPADFPSERGQRDGTLAHAMERLFSLVVENSGYRVIEMMPEPSEAENMSTHR